MKICHQCGNHDISILIDFGKHPVSCHLLNEKTAQEYVHEVQLCLCEDCGLIQLANPIPPEVLYTEYLTLSAWKPQPHVSRLIQQMKSLQGLSKKSYILEIGCNDGSFLSALKSEGYENMLGVEPAKDAIASAREKGINTVSGYFDTKMAQDLVSKNGTCDFLIVRQVLEHVTDMSGFKNAIKTVLHTGSYVLFEVPNFEFSLKKFDYSAIWEEHVNYFTLQTLERYLATVGIRIVHSETYNFSGEALIVFGEYTGEELSLPEDSNFSDLRKMSLAFKDKWPVFKKALKENLAEYKNSGKRVGVYGAGCRSCALINFAGLGSYIEFIIDDHPEKQNKFLPGARLPIFTGDKINEGAIDLCLLAVNAENETKVLSKCQYFHKNGGEILSINPPSDLLLPFWKTFE